MSQHRLFAIPIVSLVLLVAACGGNDDDSNANANSVSNAANGNAQELRAGGGLADLNQGIVNVVDEIVPSVVAVAVGQGEGSGVIWDEDGHIVTNHHVIAQSPNVTVVLASGERLQAEVVAQDPRTDIAVLRVDREGLTPANFRTDSPAVGSLVLAIGNPLGFESSVTLGIVSGLHRSIPSGGATPALVDLMQTDAAISPGNSGGALVNLDGEVVGINVAYIPPQQQAVALGFAIPSATVQDVVEQLLETGTVEHAYIGLEPRPLNEMIAAQLGLPVSQGAFVFALQPGGPGAQGGLQEGDVIVEFNGAEIATVEDLYAQLRAHSPGDEVELGVVRNGAEETVNVTLANRPQ